MAQEFLKRIRQIEIGTNRVTSVLLLLSVLGFLCSCATAPEQSLIVPVTELPADVPINKEAGRGGDLTIMVRLENGEELPMVVDTGAPGTVFDKSLDTKLGKQRGTINVRLAQGTWQKDAVFKSPKLYLQNTALRLGPIVAAHDFNRHPMGILGMDCLKHYYIQLDFQAGKMRFLGPGEVNVTNCGKAFPLTFEHNYPFIHQAGLFGDNTNLLVDLGCNIDGLYNGKTNQALGVYSPECRWMDHSYTNLIVAFADFGNVIGLRFLARHLVTFDFPGNKMYLKQVSVGPLESEEQEIAPESARRSALRTLRELRDARQLPGWPTGKTDPIFFDEKEDDESRTMTCTLWVDHEFARYHYRLERASKEDPWKLRKAWQTNDADKLVEEYPVP
ncbi:MAG TPA: retropepsin-like aspartic protease [Verrucomicrobiae bacterium]